MPAHREDRRRISIPARSSPAPSLSEHHDTDRTPSKIRVSDTLAVAGLFFVLPGSRRAHLARVAPPAACRGMSRACFPTIGRLRLSADDAMIPANENE